MIRFVANVVWLLLCGIWTALAYGTLAVLFFVLVVTIPLGIASLRMAVYSLWPYGRTLVARDDAGVPSLLGNVVWFVLAGLWLAMAHALVGTALCLTIIGMPLGVGHWKLAIASLNPLGKTVAPVGRGSRRDLYALPPAGPLPPGAAAQRAVGGTAPPPYAQVVGPPRLQTARPGAPVTRPYGPTSGTRVLPTPTARVPDPRR